MSRNFDMIQRIDDKKETFKLAVRIVDLWHVQIHDKSKHLEMVLMDGKRDRIHAVVKRDELESWESELKEQKTYYMYNFKVVPNNGQYKVCQHGFKLFFTGGTTLRQVDLPDILVYSYEFKSFEEIVNGSYDPKLLIDIIGIVKEVKFQLLSGNPPKVVFNLKDFSGQVISCTLWSQHATKFMCYLKDNPENASIIIVLTQARLKPPQGVHGLTISNSLYGSKLLINDEVPDLGIYKERLSATYLGQPSNISQSLSVGQQSGGSQFSELERFLYKSKVLKLSEIGDLRDGTNFCTIGTTTKLIAGKGGWFYNSCERCNKKADREDESYTCSCGKFNEISMARYRVEIMVSDKKDSANFVFWDQDCTEVIGMSTIELREIMIKSEEGDPKHFPHPLDKMLGLRVALKAKYQTKFNCSSMSKMSTNYAIIQAITEQISTEMDATGTVKPLCNKIGVVDTGGSLMEDSAQYDTQTLSATADHDPEQDTILTLTKRSSSELSGDDLASEEAPATQLSATKLSKTIKTE